MFRYLRILCVLLFVTSAALSVSADTVTYTFESPQFTVGQRTPLLNRAPNIGSPTFLTSFTSSPTANGFEVAFAQPNPLFQGNALFESGGPLFDTLTLIFNMPVASVQFVFAINQPPTGAPGRVTLTSPAGSQTQMAGNVGGFTQGGTFSFSSLTPFTTLQLQAFGGLGQPVEFGIDNLTLTTQVIPEPATVVLLGTGLAGIAAKVRKRRQAKMSDEV
jgi:hypothetical protein